MFDLYELNPAKTQDRKFLLKSRTFADRVKVNMAAGDGGDGCVAFRREKFVPLGGPAGGNGGHGGSIYIRASKDKGSLITLYYQPHQRAERGGAGRGKQCHGKSGRDLYVQVPCGTEVREADTGTVLGEVIEDGDTLLIASGGKGGWGNMRFATSTHQAPREFTPGEKGEARTVILELKSVADVGLVGYPNAGKSTLLGQISRAHPKIASYPFTTLHPVIGIVTYEDFRTLRVADIPGLIAGAHEGVGLGDEFLRHIERSRFLVFVIDMAGVDGRDPAEDYVNLRRELKQYREELASRPYLLAANKMDVPEAEDNRAAFEKKTGEQVLPVSARKGDGVEALKDRLYQAFFASEE